MKTTCLFLRASLALGAALLAQAALAQSAPIEPLAPARVALVLPRLEVVGHLVPRSSSASIRIVCRPSTPAIPPVLLLLNSRILMGQQMLAHLNPSDIADVHVYKNTSGLPGWPAFTSVSGLIDVTLKRGIRVPATISLRRLKHRLHLAGPVQFEQYGQLLPTASLRLAKTDVQAVTVQKAKFSATHVLLPAGVPPPTPPQPATSTPRIMIRGAASQ